MPTSALKSRQITKFGQNGTVVANISYDCRHASEEGARVALVGPQEPLDRADTEVKASSSTLVLRCNNNKTDLTAMTHRLTAVGTTKVDSTLCVRCKESFFNGPFFTLYGDHAPGIFFCTLSYHVQVPGVWHHLARASVARFSSLERASGIKIHKTSGYLGVAGPRFVGFKEWMKASQDFEEKGQAKVIQRSEIRGSFSLQVCDPDSLPDHLDFLCLPSESVSCYEPGGGHLSPRTFVAAQLILARRQGARLVLCSELSTRQSLLHVDQAMGLCIDCPYH